MVMGRVGNSQTTPRESRQERTGWAWQTGQEHCWDLVGAVSAVSAVVREGGGVFLSHPDLIIERTLLQQFTGLVNYASIKHWRAWYT
jgi:hypothetical protein